MCRWLIIFLGQLLWLSSNSSSAVGPRNSVGTSAASGSGVGKGPFGAAVRASSSAGARSGSGSVDGASYNTTGEGALSCSNGMIFYYRPQNKDK